MGTKHLRVTDFIENSFVGISKDYKLGKLLTTTLNLILSKNTAKFAYKTLILSLSYVCFTF